MDYSQHHGHPTDGAHAPSTRHASTDIRSVVDGYIIPLVFSSSTTGKLLLYVVSYAVHHYTTLYYIAKLSIY